MESVKVDEPVVQEPTLTPLKGKVIEQVGLVPKKLPGEIPVSWKVSPLWSWADSKVILTSKEPCILTTLEENDLSATEKSALQYSKKIRKK